VAGAENADPIDRPTSARIDSIGRSAGAMAEDLDRMREVCSLLDDDCGRAWSPVDFVQELPGLLRGYIRQIRDTRSVNIEIAADIEGHQRTQLTRHDMMERLLPMILTIMDESICSGQIRARLRDSDNAGAFAIEFPHKIVGHLSIEDLAGRLFPAQDISANAIDMVEIQLDNAGIRVEAVDGKDFRITYESFAKSSAGEK
jgi:hypothetical protein